MFDTLPVERYSAANAQVEIMMSYLVEKSAHHFIVFIKLCGPSLDPGLTL